jgi:Glycoside-hydrolase family GH114
MRTLVAALTLAVLGPVLPGQALQGAAAPSVADVTLPSSKTEVDYQLGGNAKLPEHVGIVVRDRHAAPSKRAYSVCYVNGFQTQPDERRFWRSKHWNLVLKKNGKPVVDSAWGEWLLDSRTPAKRRALRGYRKKDFRFSCRRWGAKLPIVLRDRALSPTGTRRYC